MTLAEELALTCVSALRKQAAETAPFATERERFETSTRREELLRRHAERLQELARSRAAEEDVTPGGYVETAAKRLLPVPHTLGEAAVRVPAMLAGGAYGRYLARPYETPAADVIHSVLAGKAAPGPKGPKGMAAVPPLEKRVADYLTEQGAAPDVAKDTAQRLLRRLGVQRPEHVEGALEVLPIFDRAKSKALRQEIARSLGEKGLPFLRREISLLGEPEVKTLSQRLGRLRWGGAMAGGLAAGALTGLPYVARALYQKRRGGEAAARAYADAQAAVEAANREWAAREEILKGVEGSNQGSETVARGAL